MSGFKRRRRRKIRQRPFPDAWEAILQRNMEVYGRLPESDRAELRGHVQVFLHEKKFTGCGGFEITDEVRVTIAAQACLLLLHRETDYYPQLTEVLVYPHTYFSTESRHVGAGVMVEGPSVRLGESWRRGPVVLSWDDVRRGAADADDGRNVALHEFAHQLDDEDGDTNGAPALPVPGMYQPWARIMQSEYDELHDDIEHHRKAFIDTYGATNPAEFFAVVTEAFFEKPNQLKRRHPELYKQFATFYEQDPAQWGKNGG